ncbi:MAG: hypothetical protein QM640_07230 [Niabella sp.]
MIFIHQHICNKSTGSPKEFAEKSRVSQSHLMNLMNDMKALGFPIKYNRTTKTYYYDGDGSGKIPFSNATLLTREQMSLIKGGDEKSDLCFSEKTIFEKC